MSDTADSKPSKYLSLRLIKLSDVTKFEQRSGGIFGIAMSSLRIRFAESLSPPLQPSANTPTLVTKNEIEANGRSVHRCIGKVNFPIRYAHDELAAHTFALPQLLKLTNSTRC